MDLHVTQVNVGVEPGRDERLGTSAAARTGT
jgi:hypothetical protein